MPLHNFLIFYYLISPFILQKCVFLNSYKMSSIFVLNDFRCSNFQDFETHSVKYTVYYDNVLKLKTNIQRRFARISSQLNFLTTVAKSCNYLYKIKNNPYQCFVGSVQYQQEKNKKIPSILSCYEFSDISKTHYH